MNEYNSPQNGGEASAETAFKAKEQTKWAVLAGLVVVLIFTLILRFGSTSSEENLSVYADEGREVFVQTIPKPSPSTKSRFSDVPQQSPSPKQPGYGFSKYYYRPPRTAENGSYYGQISETTGRPKTVHVRGYYRKDGTYVRSHYRSPPRR